MQSTPKTRCTVVSPAGEKIIKALEEKGETRAWLARQADITPAYVTFLIQGKHNNPTLNVIRKIQASLNTIIW